MFSGPVPYLFSRERLDSVFQAHYQSQSLTFHPCNRQANGSAGYLSDAKRQATIELRRLSI
ncbi:hypothetical protein, partial [Endozoicomonas sp. ALC066]|uniref:hypothetical protein n=1 Tax=Endozoicomonas sp. ALC066 TaxID=3403078 RepID=UPI003BB737DC